MSIFDKSDWLFEVADLDNTLPVRLTGVHKRSLTLGLNGAGEASFEMDLDDAKAIERNLRAGRSRLNVYRNDTIMWSGVIMVVDRYFEDVNGYVRVQALGWYWFLSKRFVGIDADDVHTAEDAGAIAWDLINQTQLETYGDLGITQGTIETSNNLTITYTRQNIKDAIDNLVAEGGIDFEITPTKIFNVYYPLKGTDRTSTVIFRYPGNILRFRDVRDSTTVVNDESILGQGLGTEEITATRNDTGSQSIYGNFQKIASYKDIDNVTVLGNIAEYEVALLKAPRETIEMKVIGNGAEIDLNEYNVGDLIRVKVTKTNFTLDNVFRIFQIAVTIDEEDREDISIVAAIL